MLYLVEAHPSVERANVVDAGEGPGPVIAKNRGEVPSEGDLRQSVTPSSFHGSGARYSGEDGRTDVRPRLVCRCRAHIHSAHVGGDLWRSDRQREEDYKTA